jgi:hypothetical protein
LPEGHGSHIETTFNGYVVRVDGVKGTLKFSTNEWEGVKDVLDQHKAHDREDARKCAKELLPVVNKAYEL